MSGNGNPIPDSYVVLMQGLAEAIDQFFNGKDRSGNIGFVLLAFDRDQDIKGTGKVNYVGNSDRHDTLVALKEFVARWEGLRPGMPDVDGKTRIK